MGIIEMFIIGAITAGIIFGFKKVIWKDSVPNLIEKYRIVIVILISIIIIAVGIFLNLDVKFIAIYTAFVAYLSITSLKNEIKKGE